MQQSNVLKNLILDQLQPQLRQRLATALKPRWLNRHDEIALGTDVVFPLGAVISLVDKSPDSLAVEGASIGFEGLLCLSELRDVRAVVQIGGESLSLNRTVYDELQDTREFRTATDRYRDRVLGLAFRTSVCLVSHSTEQRLATSLLAMQDRCGRDQLELTQEYLATLLGVRRPTVTIAAGLLQGKGLIRYRYGHVTIADRLGLESAACACFGFTHSLFMH